MPPVLQKQTNLLNLLKGFNNCDIQASSARMLLQWKFVFFTFLVQTEDLLKDEALLLFPIYTLDSQIQKPRCDATVSAESTRFHAAAWFLENRWSDHECKWRQFGVRQSRGDETMTKPLQLGGHWVASTRLNKYVDASGRRPSTSIAW